MGHGRSRQRRRETCRPGLEDAAGLGRCGDGGLPLLVEVAAAIEICHGLQGSIGRSAPCLVPRAADGPDRALRYVKRHGPRDLDGRPRGSSVWLPVGEDHPGGIIQRVIIREGMESAAPDQIRVFLRRRKRLQFQHYRLH